MCSAPTDVNINTDTTLNSHTTLVALALEEIYLYEKYASKPNGTTRTCPTRRPKKRRTLNLLCSKIEWIYLLHISNPITYCVLTVTEVQCSEADVARSLLFTISNDIGQIACLYAMMHQLNKVSFLIHLSFTKILIYFHLNWMQIK